MSFFDFSEDVRRAQHEAANDALRLCAKTTVHRAEFPKAVARAGFKLLARGGFFVPGRHDLLIGAAPWSDTDLEVLEDLVSIVRGRTVRVTVFDIDDLSLDEIRRLVPEGRMFRTTPVVMQYREGHLTYYGEGRDATFWLRQF